MKKYFLVLLILFFSSCLYASGRTEIPTNYINIGQLDLTLRKTYNTILLPYIKPEGISKILTSNVQGLIIEEIIVNGKKIKPKRELFYMGTDEAISYLNEKNVNIEEAQFMMPMTWNVLFDGETLHDDLLKEGIYFNYYSRNGQIRYNPDKYIIPYGNEEVFITYRIRFPIYPDESRFREFIVSDELYTVKFNILWPELRIADRHGRITPPDNYINLGTQDFNSNNELSIKLPLYFPSPSRFDEHIDNEWLKIYQLIADGLLIESKNLNFSERHNINYLITTGEIMENNSKVLTQLKRNSNGIDIYVKTSNQSLKYTIPYGSCEIFLTYDVILNSRVGHNNYNRRYCVKWDIKWN